MSEITLENVQVYHEAVDSMVAHSDTCSKGTLNLIAKCEQLDKELQDIHTMSLHVYASLSL
jgi:hypothetical protein